MIKIIKHYYVSESVYKWVRGLADWDATTPATYDLFVSLLTRSSWRYRINPTSDVLAPLYPLQWSWLRKIKAKVDDISDILCCDNSYTLPINNRSGKCKYYWIHENILRQFDAIVYNRKEKHCVNLYTGKRARVNRPLPTDVMQPSLYSDNRNLITSQLIADSIRNLTNMPVRVNIYELEKYIGRLTRWFAHISPMQIHNPALKGRLGQHIRMGQALLVHLQRFRRPGSASKYVSYKQVYTLTATGRITEQNYGLQSCSREMRRKLLHNIDVINYDLQNCQLTCLHYLLPDSALKTELAKKISRIYADADAMGLPKKLVKPYLYAQIYNLSKKNYRISSVVELRKYCRTNNLMSNLADYDAGLDVLRDAVNTLLSLIISNYKTHMSWINAAGVKLSHADLDKLAQRKLDEYLRNNTSMMCFSRDDYLKHAKNKILIAFYIQGVETYIIHSLTVRQKCGKYKVISNQHDGIIIIAKNGDGVDAQMSQINQEMGGDFKLVKKQL